MSGEPGFLTHGGLRGLEIRFRRYGSTLRDMVRQAREDVGSARQDVGSTRLEGEIPCYYRRWLSRRGFGGPDVAGGTR
ncbi:MAG: hypothetical protein ACYDB1_10640 [Acidiferrobacteraceae bacterium]